MIQCCIVVVPLTNMFYLIRWKGFIYCKSCSSVCICCCSYGDIVVVRYGVFYSAHTTHTHTALFRPRYLCLGNLKDANIVYDEFIRLHGSQLHASPLLNFLRFLLLTLERDAFPLFDVLRKKYRPSIERDPQFSQVWRTITKIIIHPCGARCKHQRFLIYFSHLSL